MTLDHQERTRDVARRLRRNLPRGKGAKATTMEGIVETDPLPLLRCGYYWAGHEVHMIQALRSVNDMDSRPLLGRVLNVEDDGTLVVEVESTVHYLWNHDPERLRLLVAQNDGAVTYQPRWSVLRTRSSESSSHAFSVAKRTAPERRSCPETVPGRIGI